MNALGIILAGGSNSRMKKLIEKRALAAMPVGCSYRAVDFTLSAMTNSGIQTVAILSQYNTRSLNLHLSSSKYWNFGRKQGGLFVFAPQVTPESSWFYRGTADAMWQNMDFLAEHHEPYVVIAGGDGIYKMDFAAMLEYHITKNADITVACAHMPDDGEPERFGIVKMDSDGVITDFEEKPMIASSDLVSAGIYIIKRRRLMELLEQCNLEDRYSFVTGVLTRLISTKKIYGYMMEGYWNSISSPESYYNINMDMLKPELQKYFFVGKDKVYSKAMDVPPTKYNEGSDVRNSLVGSGSIINSRVENSVLFKNVFVGSNSIIKNSVILHGAYIGDNVQIENCIVESNETIPSGSTLICEDGIRVIAEGNTRVEAAKSS